MTGKPGATPARRSEKEILADWRQVRDARADLDSATPGWAERSAEIASRSADLIEEACRLDPVPREITMFVVGVAVHTFREHATRMRGTSPTAPQQGRCRHCGDGTEDGDDPLPSLCAMCGKAGRS